MNFFLNVDQNSIEQALESWQWLELSGKNPILVTVFADLFFADNTGIYFLDTVSGSLEFLCKSTNELDLLLQSSEAKEKYLFYSLVEIANENKMNLEAGECFDFKINPSLGGQFEFENIEKSNFRVALNTRGQIGEQVRNLPEGSEVSNISISKQENTKPWWKAW